MIEPVLLAINYKIQQSNETQSKFVHCITMVQLIDSITVLLIRNFKIQQSNCVCVGVYVCVCSVAWGGH